MAFPVAVPEKIIGLTLALDFSTAATSYCSLYLPQVALANVPYRVAADSKNLQI